MEKGKSTSLLFPLVGYYNLKQVLETDEIFPNILKTLNWSSALLDQYEIL